MLKHDGLDIKMSLKGLFVKVVELAADELVRADRILRAPLSRWAYPLVIL